MEHGNHIIFSCNFNLCFNISLDAKGGSPMPIKCSLSKIIEIKEQLDVCDIWRIRNPKVKHFTLRQQYCSGYIQQRLDYSYWLSRH